MNLKKLLAYCKEKDIFVPPKATKEVVERAIVRAAMHGTKVKQPKNCFGFWADENGTCLSCDYEPKCFKASLGVEKDKYLQAFERRENKKLRFKRVNKRGKIEL